MRAIDDCKKKKKRERMKRHAERRDRERSVEEVEEKERERKRVATEDVRACKSGNSVSASRCCAFVGDERQRRKPEAAPFKHTQRAASRHYSLKRTRASSVKLNTFFFFAFLPNIVAVGATHCFGSPFYALDSTDTCL